MRLFFIFSLIVLASTYLYKLLFKRIHVLLVSTIFASVLLNFFLLLLGWSDLVVSQVSWETYLLIIYVELGALIVLLLSKPNVVSRELLIRTVTFHSIKINVASIIVVISVILLLSENLIVSGTLFPYLHGLDTHVSSAPLIGVVTRSFLVLSTCINYIQYYNSSKLRFLLYEVVLLAIVFLGSASRLLFSFCVLLIVILWFTYNPKRKKRFLASAFLGILLFVALMLFVFLGTERITRGGKYNIQYHKIIRYTGPFSNNDSYFTELLGIYYGYFPLSLNNLDISIDRFNRYGFHHTNGLLTLSPLFVAIFQLNEFFDYPLYNYIYEVRDISDSAATVSTGLFTFYVDFGNLGFIGIGLHMLIGYFLHRFSNRSAVAFLNYSLFCTCWYFMSFIDVFMMMFPIYFFVITLLLSQFHLIKMV